MAGRHPRRLRSLAGGVALAVVSIAATLLVLEISLRTFPISVGTHYISRKTIERSPDERLQFQLKPNSRVHAEVDYVINEHGMRNDPVETEKPPGTRRVAVLGDSIPFGYWVRADDAFPAQIEAMLATSVKTSDRVEVLNFGVPGYDLKKYVQVLRTRVLRFHPDAVVLSFCMNDANAIFSSEYGRVVRRERAVDSGGLARLRDFALDHFILASWVDYRLSAMEARKKMIGRAVSRPSPPRDQRWTALQLDVLFAEFAQILADAGNVPGLVAIFPTFDFPFDRYPNSWLHRLAANTAQTKGLHVVDLLACFSAYAPTDVRVDAVHPGPMGHRVGAHGIVAAMAEYGMLAPAVLDLATLGDCRSYRPDAFERVRGY